MPDLACSGIYKYVRFTWDVASVLQHVLHMCIMCEYGKGKFILESNIVETILY